MQASCSGPTCEYIYGVYSARAACRQSSTIARVCEWFDFCLAALRTPIFLPPLTNSEQYVRRELRTLLEEDRATFLNVLEIIYRVPTKQGVLMYGHDYKVT